jgi:pimeloyl-ACP methyl ester carboxylesterase
VQAGEGPLVICLHGFPQYWYAWRNYLPRFAAAGLTAVAVDLRGYGGSDHPPDGYDPYTLSADVAGVIAVLGFENAAVVGHGWGGQIGWTMTTAYPKSIRSLVAISAPHPRRLRESLIKQQGQLKATLERFMMQIPWWTERTLRASDALEVEKILRRWSKNPSWLTLEVAANYRAAMKVLDTAHCSLEYNRWATRSLYRTDGINYFKAMSEPTAVPVLQIHGRNDRLILAETARGSDEYVNTDYELVELAGVGHFPHEEAAGELVDLVTNWLSRPANRTGQ